MKAVYSRKTGDSSHIIVGEFPIPEISENKVLIKVQAVPVNYVDSYIQSGAYQTELPTPFILGRDAVGQVIKVGRSVDSFSVGDLVWTNSMGYDGRQGVMSEFALIPQERLYHVPDNVNPLQLVAAVHSAATASIVLTDIIRIKQGETILIEGAGGHVGSKLTALASAMGARVLTTSQEKDFKTLTDLGSCWTLDYRSQYKSQILEQYPEGIQYIIDTSGKVSLQDNSDLLAFQGTIVLITSPKDNVAHFDSKHFYMNCQQIKGFVISRCRLEQLNKAAMTINSYFAEGKLLEDDIRLMTFDAAASAYQLLKEGAERKKLVLIP